MIVYRIEHESVLNPDTHFPAGPCNPADDFGCLHDKVLTAQQVVFDVMNNREGKPTPWCDRYLGWINPDEVCGVDSKKDLEFWFEDSVKFLERAGFTIHKYDVPDWACRVGESGQVLFKHQYATLVNKKGKNHE